MILLKILSGTQAGAEKVARRFPVQVGRQAGAHLQLLDDGVWDSHFKIQLSRREGFTLTSRPEAPTRLNLEAFSGSVALRNGDIISAGSARIQFWLSPTRQPSRRVLEFMIWAGIAGVTLAQVWLIYWLLHLAG